MEVFFGDVGGVCRCSWLYLPTSVGGLSASTPFEGAIGFEQGNTVDGTEGEYWSKVLYLLVLGGLSRYTTVFLVVNVALG